jgi:hypothetical protein
VERESTVVHGEIPKEEATVKTVRLLKEQYGDQHLTVGRHRLLKQRTQGNGGSRKKLDATHRGITRHTIPAPCKVHGHQGPGRDNVVRGAPKEQMLERR